MNSSVLNTQQTLSVQKQIEVARVSISQLDDQIRTLREYVDYLRTLVTSNVPTSRIVQSVENIKPVVHSSQMPDQKGVNADHDKRYYTKAEVNHLLTGYVKIT